MRICHDRSVSHYLLWWRIDADYPLRGFLGACGRTEEDRRLVDQEL